MRYLASLFLFGIFFVPYFSFAYTPVTTCVTASHNFNTSVSGTLIGTAINTSGTVNQADSGSIDCVGFPVPDLSLSLSPDSSVLYLYADYDGLDYEVFTADDFPSSSLFDGILSYADSFVFGDSIVDDGLYFINSHWPSGEQITPFYVFDGRFYLSVPSSCGSSTSTPCYSQDSGNLTFALAILIVISFLMVTGFAYNSITSKKPWSR